MDHDDQNIHPSLERMRRHLARADDELKAAQRLLDPRSPAGTELNRAVAAARISVNDAMESVRLRMSEADPG